MPVTRRAALVAALNSHSGVKSKSKSTSERAKTLKKQKPKDNLKPKLKIPTMKAVNEASMLYAKELNRRPLTPVVQAILDKANVTKDKKGTKKTTGKFVAAPYMFIGRNGLDYEAKSQGYELVETLFIGVGEDELINLETDKYAWEGPIADTVAYIWKKSNLGKTYKRFAGIMGIKIHNDDGTEFGDHYVAYVYDNGKLAFFDSGAPGTCSKQITVNNTYVILRSAIHKLSGTRKQLENVCNIGIFETAAGASEDDNNYIGQNIFCHSWSMWFIYQYVVMGKDMTEIDRLAGSGDDADRDNLLRIKTFVYDVIIPLANLSFLYDAPKFQAFRYYIHDDLFKSKPQKEGDDDDEDDIEPPKKKPKTQRSVMMIPQLSRVI